MTILKDQFTISCSGCDKILGTFDCFYDATKAKFDQGWRAGKRDESGWVAKKATIYCPSCYDKIEKEGQSK